MEPGSHDSEPAEMTPDSAEPTEQRARIDKLTAETDLIRQQLSPKSQFYERLKVITGFGGVIAGVAAIFSLLFSTCQWFKSAEATREVQIEEHLHRGLTLLGDAVAPARLAGVVSLNSFLRGDHKKQIPQVLLAFTNALALEPSETVRNALVASIDSLDEKATEKVELDRALWSLIRVSRGLVQEGQLWRQRRSNFFFPPSPDTIESRAVSVAAAVSALLRKSARVTDMSKTYLAGEDFRNLNLAGVSFNDSILAASDFGSAVLDGATFVDADLDNVKFTNAKLRGADFRQTTKLFLGRELHYDYVEEQMNRRLKWWREESPQPLRDKPPQFVIYGPDFHCADLAQANFTGHPLLPVFPDSLPDSMSVATLSFRGANLSGATFYSLKVFGIGYEDNDVPRTPFPLLSDARAWMGLPRSYAYFVKNVLDDKAAAQDRTGYDGSFRELARIFGGSNWKDARMPDVIEATLGAIGAESVRSRSGCE